MNNGSAALICRFRQGGVGGARKMVFGSMGFAAELDSNLRVCVLKIFNKINGFCAGVDVAAVLA